MRIFITYVFKKTIRKAKKLSKSFSDSTVFLTNFSRIKWYNLLVISSEYKEWIILTVYTDILFLTNFVMDYLIISVCTTIVPSKTKHIRKISAALLGGLYGMFIFIPDLEFIYSVFSVFLFSAAIAAILFLPCKLKDYFRYLLVYYITSFIW